MMKALLFSILCITISCSLQCEEYNSTVISPEECHKLKVDTNQYCCYYEGKNLDTNLDEKSCWAFRKEQIDSDTVKATIEAIEKGTDSHVTKKHSGVKLDCFGFFEKYNLYLLFALILMA